MIRVVIVEDEPASRANLRRLASAYPDVEVVGECGDGEAAVRTIVDVRPDLVFLDVQLPGMDGFDVLESLPSDRVPAVVFVTAHDDFAVRAFERHAVDYLLKPFGRVRFAKAFGHAVERLQARHLAGGEREQPDGARGREAMDDREPLTRFATRRGRTVHFVPLDDVDWIDTADNYLRLHCAGRIYMVRGTLSEVAGRLPARQFVRVHRGLLLRVDRIVSIQSSAPGIYALTLRDGACLSSSRGYATEVRALLR